MNIAMVSLYPNRNETHIKASGVASYTKNLLTSMPRQPGDHVYVVCNKAPGAQPEHYQEDGLVIMRTFDRTYKFVGQIYRQIKRINPDVVHIQHEIPLYGGLHTAFMLPLLLFLLRRYKVVITLHHVVSLQKIDRQFVRANKSAMPVWAVKLAFRIIMTSLVRFADKVITHEPYFRDVLIKEYQTSGN